MEIEQVTRDRTSQELRCEDLGRRLEQVQAALRAGEQEKAEAVQSCYALTQQVDRLEAELGKAKSDYTHVQQDMHALHRVSLTNLFLI